MTPLDRMHHKTVAKLDQLKAEFHQSLRDLPLPIHAALVDMVAAWAKNPGRIAVEAPILTPELGITIAVAATISLMDAAVTTADQLREEAGL